MKQLFKISIILFFIMCFAHGQNIPSHHSMADIYCKECHSCDNPTEKDPCLICCPEYSRKGITVRHTADEAPEIITLDVIADNYNPSYFTHRLHAEMADMTGGCVSCHHYNPPGVVAACRQCHNVDRQRDNLRKPDLKAAYHRQCLNCHRNWNNKIDCIICHSLKSTTSGESDRSDKKEFVGKKHPRVERPAKYVYQTEYEEGPVVTFYHNDHVRMYQLECTSCHQNESCGRCHDQMKKMSTVVNDTHQNCIKCHEKDIDDKCNKCHDLKERSPFDHASTGFKLKSYHQNLNCQTCHGKGGQFNKLNKTCNSCHKKWQTGNFDHSVTGLKLDENHVEQECSSCHQNQNYSKKPQCVECHDDLAYPQNKPGIILSVTN